MEDRELPQPTRSTADPGPPTREALHAPDSNEGELIQRLLSHRAGTSRYELVDQVAEGGMGVIWRVWDTDLRRHLAMKISREQADVARAGSAHEQGALVGRFLEEAQITGQLDHPGIVPVHELGLGDDGSVYFTMRLVRGRELREIIALVHQGGDGWTLTRALGVVLRICECMSFAHDKGVLHRDLKPANVMVGRYGEVYVMDWGLARVLAREDEKGAPARKASETVRIRSDRRDRAAHTPDSPLLTMDGDVIGTPSYMSPEQALGQVEAVGPHSDVYSVGAILYHLAAGHMPYTPQDGQVSNHDVLMRVLQGPPTPLTELRSDLPPELVAICEKAMAPDIAARYASMADLAADLRAFLEDRVVRAHRTGPIVELKKWVQRNRPTAYSVAASLLLLFAVAAAGSLVLSRKNRDLLAANQSAELATERAVRRFDQVRHLANTFLDLETRLRVMAGSTSTRQLIADEGLLYLDSLASEAAGDRALLYELAQGYIKVGDVLGGIDDNLGDTRGALASYEKAHAILVDLCRADPGSRAFQFALAHVLNDRAHSLHELGRTDEAMQGNREALEIHRALLAADPDDETVRRSAMLDLRRIGDLERERGNQDDALGRYEESLAINAEMQLAAPDDAEVLFDRSVVHAKIGKVWAERDAPAEAMEHFRTAAEYGASALEREPENGLYRDWLAHHFVDLGDAHWRAGALDEALERFEGATAIWEELYALDPANVEAREDLALALERAGGVLLEQERREETLAHFERSLELRLANLAIRGDNVKARRELGVAHEKMANVLMDLERFREAELQLERARALRVELTELDPKNATARRDLGVTYFKLGSCYGMSVESGQPDERPAAELWQLSHDAYGEALRLVEQMQAEGQWSEADAHVPDLLRSRIEQCEEMLAALSED